MKKSICVFLSVMLLLCSVFSAASAASLEESVGRPSQKKEEGGGSSSGFSGSDEVSKSDDGYGSYESDNPENGLRIGDASAVITGVWLSNSKLNVTILYRNDGKRSYSYSDLFWLSVYQNKKFMQRDNQSVGILTSRRSLSTGESAEFTLTFNLPEADLPAELSLEPFNEGTAPAVSLWFDPRTGLFGTWDELNLTEDQITKAAATPAPIEKSRHAGKTDGSIGNQPGPKAETFSHPMRAYMTFKNGADKYVESGTQELQMNGSGQYTLTLESSAAVQGISYLSVAVVNAEEDHKADDAFMNGRGIRIDEIQVNGTPISFGKVPVTVKLTKRAKTGEVTNRRLSAVIFFAGREFESTANDGYYFWDGDTSTRPTLSNVNPSDFASFQSISVTFSYGYFE